MTRDAWIARLPAPLQPLPQSRSAIRQRLWKMRHLFWLAIPFLVVWGVRHIPLQAFGAALRQLSPASILALMLVNGAIFLLFSSRWWLILRAQGHRLPYLSLVKYRLAAFAISYFSPGTQFGGEPLQVYMVQDRHAVPSLVSVAAVTLDKLFEVLANSTFLAIGLLVVLDQDLMTLPDRPKSLLAITGLLALPVGYMLALWLGRFPLTGLVVRLPARLAGSAPLKKLSPAIAATERQIATLFQHHPWLILWALLLSGLTWLLMLAEFWLTFRFLGQPLTLLQTVSMLTAARLAFLLPLPGGLGALEASQVLAMQALGLDPALGLSASLLIRARDLLFGALGLGLLATFTRRASARPGLTPALEGHQRFPLPETARGQGGSV